MTSNLCHVAGLGRKSLSCAVPVLKQGRWGEEACAGRAGVAGVCVVLGRAAMWVSRHGPTHWHRAWKVKNLW